MEGVARRVHLDTVRTAASAYCGWKLAMVDNNKIIIVWVLSYGPEHGPALSILRARTAVSFAFCAFTNGIKTCRVCVSQRNEDKALPW